MNAVDRLKEWLINVSDEEAEELWEYFDSHPNFDLDLIETIISSHPKLAGA